ncbi:N-formylglutamate deformylase [Haliangium sp.]|uniref:N-formylglutamate deformylase n=1 Tax=Haliangium sp. TaxID=2663208 RepID=UPI003D0AF53D
MDIFQLQRGHTPLLVSVPHAGTHVPAAIAARLSDPAHALPDTDWHVHVLYDFAAELGASVLVATHSRYVIDLNRDPAGVELYPGQDNTGLVPLTCFDRAPVYRPGQEPDPADIEARIDAYWRPYHDALAAELDRLVAAHGHAVLFDAHSIRSRVPRFFAGTLPDLNLGSAGGTSAAPALRARAMAVLEAAAGFSCVCDGRFRGGYITRRYGRPDQSRHALQLEMAQQVYMDEAPPYRYRADLAERIRPSLRALLSALAAWTPG